MLWSTFHPYRYTRSNSVWSFVILTTLDSDVLFYCGAYFVIYLLLWVSVYLCWRISRSPDHSVLCWNRARHSCYDYIYFFHCYNHLNSKQVCAASSLLYIESKQWCYSSKCNLRHFVSRWGKSLGIRFCAIHAFLVFGPLGV